MTNAAPHASLSCMCPACDAYERASGDMLRNDRGYAVQVDLPPLVEWRPGEWVSFRRRFVLRADGTVERAEREDPDHV